MIPRKSFTLLELLVSAVILVTVLAGVLASFVSVRKAVVRSARRLTAFNLARGILEDLYKEVDASSWDSGRLSSGYSEGTTATIPPENITYTLNYTVNNVTGHLYRQAVVNITYPE